MRAHKDIRVSGVIPRRRRSVATESLKKATFQMPASVVEAIKRAVQVGEAPSANALVEQAVREKLREMRRARVYQAYAKAVRDPVFLADMNSTTLAFEVTTADGLPAERQ